jgi:hypothetical protein
MKSKGLLSKHILPVVMSGMGAIVVLCNVVRTIERSSELLAL